MYERITKKVIIDPYRGGDDIGNTTSNLVEKDFNLEISNYIYKRLKELKIPVSITRTDDSTIDTNSRINKIKSFYGTDSDVIVISNALTNGEEGSSIVYALRNNNNLSKTIANELEKTNQPFNKYYQRRLPSDTSKDYNQLIRDTANNETIIIYYGNVDNETELNNLINNKEELGEAIVIALTNYLNLDYIPPNDNSYYKVVKGDTLYSIAKKHNTTVSELKQTNNLSTNTITIGQILKLPTNYENSSPTNNTINYKVVKGDTLYSIAKRYNTTTNELKTLNNLTTNLLSIGQTLKIPSPKTSNITYKVSSGDTLYSIAKKYNTTINELKTLNNLTTNLLSIGQILKIPS